MTATNIFYNFVGFRYSPPLMRIISSLKSNTASGPDGISSVMLNGCAGSISSYLSTLFNCSLSLGRVSQDWKTSNIIPIFKSDEPSLVSNYRSISLLSIVSKIQERVVHNSLMLHVLQHNFLSARQLASWQLHRRSHSFC